MISAVFFDLDGTLMDTVGDITRAVNQALTQYGYERLSVDQLRPIISYGSAHVLKTLRGIDPDHPDFKHIVSAVLSYYPTIMSENTDCFDGFHDTLDKLDQIGIPWGVISNKREKLVQQILLEKNLLHRTQIAYGADTFDQKKPHPKPLLEAARYVNLAPEQCLYVGDCKNDIIAAKAAGMPSAVVNFGYVPNDNSHYQWQADFYLDHPSDLLQHLPHQ